VNHAIRAALLELTVVCVVVLFLSVGVGHGAAADIEVAFSPELELVTPLDELVAIRVAVRGGAERPVDLSLKLWAPPRGKFFTTDFPLVEGTQLIQMNVRLPDGRLDWGYAFPIRGTYRLELHAADAAGQAFERTVLIEIKEHWTKWSFLFVFLAGLFTLGLVAGRFFSAGAVTGLCLIAAIAALLPITNAGPVSAPVESRLTVSSPRVGSLSTIRWSGPGADLRSVGPVDLTMRIAQLEKDRTVFQLNRLATEGSFQFGFQFADASAHLVETTAALESGQEVVQTRETIQVTSTEPPLRDRLMPVLVSLLVVAAGLITGRMSKTLVV